MSGKDGKDSKDNVHYGDFKGGRTAKGGAKKKDKNQEWLDKLTAAANAVDAARGSDKDKAKASFRALVSEIPEEVAREISGNGAAWKELLGTALKFGIAVLNLLGRRR